MALVAATALQLNGAPGAAAPGRWVETGNSPVPLEYFQGVTSDKSGDIYFDGVFVRALPDRLPARRAGSQLQRDSADV